MVAKSAQDVFNSWQPWEQDYWMANPDIQSNAYFGARPAEHYQRHGQYEGRPLRPGGSGGGGGGGFEMPDFGAAMAGVMEQSAKQQQTLMAQIQQQQQAYAAQLAAQQAEYKRLEQERIRQQGIMDRDTMYSGYLDAEKSAIDYVTNEINQERTNALLLGIDYEVTDEIKEQRIGDYFGTVWNEGQSQQLQGLVDKWGAPEGFTGIRAIGNASTYAAKDVGVETAVGVSGGMQKGKRGIGPPDLLDIEEEPLGASMSVLGV